MHIRAHFGIIEELIADQSTHAGTIDDFKATLKTHVSQALCTLDGGMGTEEHQACMTKAEELIEGYIDNVREYERGTINVQDAFLHGGRRAADTLGRGVVT